MWLTLARAPPAGDWPALPRGAPDGACPGGVLAAAASAAGPVLEPPDPPGMMSWVIPWTADAAALAAGALAAGVLVPGALADGVLADGAGTWFAPPLAAGAAGAGTLAAGAAGEEAALAAGALAGRYRLARRTGLARRCGLGRRLRCRGLARRGRPLAAAARCGRAARPREETLGRASHRTSRGCGTARQARSEPADPRGRSGAGRSALEPGFCAEAGFWLADARPARSTAKTSAAAKPPHAYRQTLTTSNKARERVADPSTANTLPPDPDIHPYPGTCRTRPHLRSCPSKGRLPA